MTCWCQTCSLNYFFNSLYRASFPTQVVDGRWAQRRMWTQTVTMWSLQRRKRQTRLGMSKLSLNESGKPCMCGWHIPREVSGNHTGMRPNMAAFSPVHLVEHGHNDLCLPLSYTRCRCPIQLGIHIYIYTVCSEHLMQIWSLGVQIHRKIQCRITCLTWQSEPALAACV